MLQERETDAEKIRLEIEAKGQATLKAAENEAKALNRLGKAYKDNRAVLQYELARRKLEVAEHLVNKAPRPLLVKSEGGEQSALSTLILAQVLPNIMRGEENGRQPVLPQVVEPTRRSETAERET
jgi:regulator of protease activity HflC (stomatin/prohibitin superfamily)